jgi:ligand-binding sensor domain-containing protein/signal transduction histidine kinase
MSLRPSNHIWRQARWWLASWLGWAGWSVGVAQTNPPAALEDLVLRTWDTEAGLPQNTINTMIQTRDGYLWLGTQDGLARFDGLRFTVFGLQEGLPSVQVTALYEDSSGTLWIGTGGGLCRMVHGEIDRLSQLRFLEGAIVSSLAGDSTGSVWIGTRTGLNIVRGETAVINPAATALRQTAINALVSGRDGAIWIATSRQGLFEFKDGVLAEIHGPPGLNEQIWAYCLLEDREGALWAGVGDGRVICRRNGTWRIYDETNGLPFAYVTSLAEAADGSIWAGSLDNGLYRLEDSHFSVLRQEEDGLSANDICSLLPDGEGNLWVGTRTGGLNRISQPKLVSCGAEQGLTNEFTRSVAQSADGTLWVGTIGGGLCKGSMEEIVRSAEETPDFWFSSVYSVLAAADGSIWYGAKAGLVRLQKQQVELVYTNDTWLRSASVTALCEDLNGGLWIGTSEAGLVHLRGREFTPFPHSVAQGSVNALAPQPDGYVWVGSEAGGLKRIRNGSDAILSVTNGLLSHAIRTLYLDAEGTLWIGTAGGGLSCRRKDGQMATFTSQQGLAAKTVSQIVEDDEGDLWLGCIRGIYRVRKSDLKSLAAGRPGFVHPRVFGYSEGMPSEECSSGFCPAGLKTREGLICFSTVRGLVFLDPRQHESKTPPPRVRLEEVMVNGQAMLASGTEPDAGAAPAAAGATPPPPMSRVRIPPGGRDIELHYTAISFAAPERASFRYRMEGLDSDWVEAGGRRVAYYYRVPPGNFTFRVSACTADGQWSEQSTALAVIVEPYVWERLWFRILMGMAAVSALAGAVRLVERWHYKQRLILLESQNAVERERLRISQDMHDDIGSVLTQVSQLSDLGQGEAAKSTPAFAQFQGIGRHARAAVQSLDEIVWATNPRNDNLPSFAEYVCRFADECCQSAAIRCWQEVPVGLPNIALRSELRHHVFLAFKEALTNVLKHSRATEVWLRLELTDREVILAIKDNGRGCAADQPAPGGNGLVNMQERLAECGGRVEFICLPESGMDIRFSFPLPKGGWAW